MFRIGDLVTCNFDEKEETRRWLLEQRTNKRSMACAAVHLTRGAAYEIIGFKNGGLILGGFLHVVSARHMRLAVNTDRIPDAKGTWMSVGEYRATKQPNTSATFNAARQAFVKRVCDGPDPLFRLSSMAWSRGYEG